MQKTLALRSKHENSLQAAAKLEDNDSRNQNGDSEDEKIAFISRKIHRMWHNKKKYFPQKGSMKSSRGKNDKSNKTNIIFYGYNEPGHVKSKYTNLKKGKF